MLNSFKCRAFYEKENDFYEVDTIFFHNGEADLVTISKGKIVKTVSTKEVQLLVATGLKDKSGNEIYDLDVVMFPNKEIALVVYTNGKFQCLFNDAKIHDPICWDELQILSNYVNDDEFNKIMKRSFKNGSV